MEQIIYFIFWGALFYFMMRMGGCCGPSGHQHGKEAHEGNEDTAKFKGVTQMAKDPVCGMDVEEGNLCSTYEGKKYCFCSQVCKKAFDKEPSRYVKAKEL